MSLPYRLAAVRVFTVDAARSIRFYRQTVGLTLESGSAEERYALFDTGATKLIIEPVDADEARDLNLIGRFVGVSFEVADVVQVHRQLEARGVRFASPPEKQPWGGVLAHFEDPDGNVLTLFQASTPTEAPRTGRTIRGAEPERGTLLS